MWHVVVDGVAKCAYPGMDGLCARWVSGGPGREWPWCSSVTREEAEKSAEVLRGLVGEGVKVEVVEGECPFVEGR